MKKSIILGCLFLAAVSFSAQEKGTKNTKPIKDTKVEVVNPIKPEVFNKESNMVVVPVADVKYQTSKTRTTRTSNNTNRPEKPIIVNNRKAVTPKPSTLTPEQVKEITEGKKREVNE